MKTNRNSHFKYIFKTWYALLFISFANAQTISFEIFKSGFTNPVVITNDNLGNLYIGENSGIIKIILSNGQESVFLDMTSKINGSYSGLHGVAFDPNYTNNGYLYIKYVNATQSKCYISRFSRNPNNLNQALLNSEYVLLEYSNWIGHLGGNIEFGIDGFLYFTTGDGAPGARNSLGDEYGYAQNLNSVKGKLMRIDVSNGILGYPTSNPYLAPNDNIPDEIIGVGLRNPWKFSFDYLTGDLWLGDVGQDNYEEIDFVENGNFENSNFGWSCLEGNNSHIVANCPPNATFISPAFTYPGYNFNGNQPVSVTGGYVYRGSQYPVLNGWYIFGDYATSDFWKTKRNTNGTFTTLYIGKLVTNPTVFGQDNQGEIYVGSYSNGTIYKLKVSCELSETLTGTHLFDSVFQLSESISSSAETITDTKIDYIAGKFIELLPGFSAIKNSTFKAEINGCE